MICDFLAGDFWNILPFVRVRRATTCRALARQVGWANGGGEGGGGGAPLSGSCRLEIALQGRRVTSMLLSMPDSEGCGAAGMRDSFLLVAPEAGPPGHAIDDEVWAA